MEYRKIVSVTGLPGLFEIISSKTDGAIVRSLDDKATRFVASRSHNLSHLESIEVYTVNDNVNLSEIFFAIDKAGTKLPEEKDAKAVKQFFEKVFPDLDFDRVYNSDMKKMVRWYSILKTHGIEVKLSEEPVEEESETIEPVAVVAEEVKPVKKAKAKKAEESVEDKPKAAKTEKAAEKPKAKKSAEKPADKPAAEKETPKKAAKKK
jgi:Domain of unknown function (DUF5606)